MAGQSNKREILKFYKSKNLWKSRKIKVKINIVNLLIAIMAKTFLKDDLLFSLRIIQILILKEFAWLIHPFLNKKTEIKSSIAKQKDHLKTKRKALKTKKKKALWMISI